jgi:hypothetical protein
MICVLGLFLNPFYQKNEYKAVSIYISKMALCRALRNSGKPCTYNAKRGELCKLHFNAREEQPIGWEISQKNLEIDSRKKEIKVLKIAPVSEKEKAFQEAVKIKMERIAARRNERYRMLNARFRDDDIRNYDYYAEEYNYDYGMPNAGAGAGAGALAPVAFHEDNQNVHRTETVALVKSSVAIIMSRKIKDPDFVWNAFRVSKTPGEIIIRCSLTPAAAVLLVQKYAATDTIYEMVPGIYGKVLDGVLQFIIESDDSVNLFKILKIELEDNVAMCAQGNLSRLCNVLGGYLEGISTASTADILGDLLPPLMSIESPYARLTAAIEILRTYNVPEDKWSDWLEPLDCKIEMLDPMLASMPGTNGRL